MRNDLQAIVDRHRARMKLVETPPGPPVIASVVAEVYGQIGPPVRGHSLLAADTVRARLAAEPGVVPMSTPCAKPLQTKRTFMADKEKGRPERYHHRTGDRRHAASRAGRASTVGVDTQRDRTQSAPRSSCACRWIAAPAQFDLGQGPRQRIASGQLVRAGRTRPMANRPAWTR